MARSEAERLLEQAITDAGVQRMALLRYLVSMGCQVCGEPATLIEQGPRLELEVVRPRVRPDRLEDVRVRVSEQVRIRCAEHEGAKADDVEAYLKRKTEALELAAAEGLPGRAASV